MVMVELPYALTAAFTPRKLEASALDASPDSLLMTDPVISAFTLSEASKTLSSVPVAV